MASYFVQQYIIAARFLATFGHFVALLVLFATIDNNIALGLPDNYSQQERKVAANTAWSALIFGFFCFLFDFSGIFFGTSLFYTQINLIQIFFHFVGSIFLSWLITDNWNYEALWPIIATCNLPPALSAAQHLKQRLSDLLLVMVYIVIQTWTQCIGMQRRR